MQFLRAVAVKLRQTTTILIRFSHFSSTFKKTKYVISFGVGVLRCIKSKETWFGQLIYKNSWLWLICKLKSFCLNFYGPYFLLLMFGVNFLLQFGSEKPCTCLRMNLQTGSNSLTYYTIHISSFVIMGYSSHLFIFSARLFDWIKLCVYLHQSTFTKHSFTISYTMCQHGFWIIFGFILLFPLLTVSYIIIIIMAETCAYDKGMFIWASETDGKKL